jgi:hypothetical protein
MDKIEWDEKGAHAACGDLYASWRLILIMVGFL